MQGSTAGDPAGMKVCLPGHTQRLLFRYFKSSCTDLSENTCTDYPNRIDEGKIIQNTSSICFSVKSRSPTQQCVLEILRMVKEDHLLT